MLKHAFCQQQQKQKAAELWLINHFREVETALEIWCQAVTACFSHREENGGEKV